MPAVRLWSTLGLALCLFFITTMAQANLQEDLPSCVRQCFTPSLPSNASSPACALKPGKDFEGSFSPCFYSACSPLDALSALNVTSIICDSPTRDISIFIRAFVLILTAVASCVIGLRVIVKLRGIAGGIGWDDWSIVIAVLVTSIATIGQFLGATYGLGRDAWKVPYGDQVASLKSFYAAAIGYKLGNACARMSILFFYLRIFGTSEFRAAVITLIVLSAFVGIGSALADSLQCSPPWLFWQEFDGLHEGRCANLSIISWVHSVAMVILDIATLAIAVWMVRGLEMRWRRKVAVIGMFALGSLTTIVSIARLWSIPPLADQRNRTWNLAPISYWSDIEMFFSLVCACLPALKQVGQIFCGSRASRHQTNSSGYLRHSSPRRSGRSSNPLSKKRTLDPTETFSENEYTANSTLGVDANSVTELTVLPNTLKYAA